MIGVVIPVHNEEELLPACLHAVALAAADPALAGEKVVTVVVLDGCTDGSEKIARQPGVRVVHCEARNVGAARRQGAALLLEAGARWLAFTDADSVVPPSWLSQQLACGTDAVCGIVAVHDWSPYGLLVQRGYLERYQAHDGHRHIHGANLGISAAAYERVGGFSPVPVHEDVALVRALEASGASIAWVAEPCVTTNSRPIGRLLGGFACYLRGLKELVQAESAGAPDLENSAAL